MRGIAPFIVLGVVFCHLGAAAQKVDAKTSGQVIPSEYVDVIYLSLNKNCYVDVKGTLPLSVDIGGDKNAISLGIQENSNIIKLKAQKRSFPEVNMIIVCKDTVLQFLIRYSDAPPKTYYPFEVAALRAKNRTEATLPKVPAQETSTASGSQKGVSANSINQWRDSSAAIETKYGVEGRNPPLMKPTNSKPDSAATRSNTPIEGPLNGTYLAEEVYQQLRTKPVNLSIGDLDGGIRAVLDRMYRDGDAYYYSLTIYNREKKDFPIDYSAFEVHRKSDNQNSNTDLLRLYQPKNPTIVESGGKTSLLFRTGKVEMAPEEFLIISITGGEKEIKIKLKKTDFDRADIFKM